MNNDRFKFRAWCEKFKVYAPINGGFSIPGEPYNIAFDPVHISADGRLYEVNNYDGKEVCQVDDVTECYTIEQCTGFRDKNGKLIFEGDYIRFEWTFKDDEVCKVVWDRKHCQFTCYDAVSGCEFITWYTAFENGSSYRCEIIGNIHEMEVLQ